MFRKMYERRQTILLCRSGLRTNKLLIHAQWERRIIIVISCDGVTSALKSSGESRRCFGDVCANHILLYYKHSHTHVYIRTIQIIKSSFYYTSCVSEVGVTVLITLNVYNFNIIHSVRFPPQRSRMLLGATRDLLDEGCAYKKRVLV